MTYDNHFGKIFEHNKIIETNNPYGYTGREIDAPELYYYRARYYDPTIQRFISEDPIGLNAGYFNTYKYVANNPVNLNDPSGENPLAALRIALLRIVALYKTIKNIRCTIRFSKADHYWGFYYVLIETTDSCGNKKYKRVKRKCFKRHIEINCRIKGLKGSAKRIQIPYGRCRGKNQ